MRVPIVSCRVHRQSPALAITAIALGAVRLCLGLMVPIDQSIQHVRRSFIPTDPMFDSL